MCEGVGRADPGRGSDLVFAARMKRNPHANAAGDPAGEPQPLARLEAPSRKARAGDQRPARSGCNLYRWGGPFGLGFELRAGCPAALRPAQEAATLRRAVRRPTDARTRRRWHLPGRSTLWNRTGTRKARQVRNGCAPRRRFCGKRRSARAGSTGRSRVPNYRGHSLGRTLSGGCPFTGRGGTAAGLRTRRGSIKKVDLDAIGPQTAPENPSPCRSSARSRLRLARMSMGPEHATRRGQQGASITPLQPISMTPLSVCGSPGLTSECP